MDLVNCPHCNLHTHARYQHTFIVSCSYCKAPVTKNKTLPARAQNGLVRKPQEFNFDLMHKYFWYDNITYQITGYIRYFYTEGYMYQWSAYNNNKHIWLCESLGNWFILSEENEDTVIDIDIATLRPNTNFIYKGQQYTVDSLSMFHNYYMEGELPEFPYLHTMGISVECSNHNGLIQFNIYQGNKVEICSGKSVSFKDLKISNA